MLALNYNFSKLGVVAYDFNLMPASATQRGLFKEGERERKKKKTKKARDPLPTVPGHFDNFPASRCNLSLILRGACPAGTCTRQVSQSEGGCVCRPLGTRGGGSSTRAAFAESLLLRVSEPREPMLLSPPRRNLQLV